MASEQDTHTTGAMDAHAHDAGGVTAEAHAAEMDAAHDAHDTGGGGHGDGHGLLHPPLTGRPLEHPPEPPHFIQVLFKKVDQAPRIESSQAIQDWKKTFEKQFIEQYTAEHGEAPSDKEVEGAVKEQLSHVIVEDWLEKDSHGELVMIDGEYVAKDDEQMTTLQLLHVGPLEKQLPLIGYAPWENHVFMGIAIVAVLFFAWLATKGLRRDRRSVIRKPTRSQVGTELFVGAIDNMCMGLLGEKHARRYMPFLGTLFTLILLMNLMGMVPLMKAPTSYVLLTLSLALCTFFVVQGTAWTTLGPGSYIYHLMGQPKGAFGWALGVLIFLPLEIISDFIAKPLSLGLRLFGNIFGKDVLLGVFTVMGVGLMSLIYEPLSHYFGIPLTPPFLLLGLLFSTLQALVFALLSAIYISLVLPHEHEEEHGVDHLEMAASGDVLGDEMAHDGKHPAPSAA